MSDEDDDGDDDQAKYEQGNENGDTQTHVAANEYPFA